MLLKMLLRFSPRNGEVILKVIPLIQELHDGEFSPRNGEVILKGYPLESA